MRRSRTISKAVRKLNDVMKDLKLQYLKTMTVTEIRCTENVTCFCPWPERLELFLQLSVHRRHCAGGFNVVADREKYIF